MARNETYTTKQKEIILNSIKEYDKEFTIKELYNKLNKSIGLTTIYRFIDKLESEDKLSKSIGKNNVAYYQYLESCLEEDHFYLKCDKCGELTHVDCECITDLANHVLNKHKFKLSHEQIIIKGLCQKCGKE